jgi:hypothetical protein
MLNLSALEHPFRYTIEVLTEDGPRAETVDLVETLDFLSGLHVERIETWVNHEDLPAPQSTASQQAGGRANRAMKAKNRNERRLLVLWRDMEGLVPVVERLLLRAG